MAKFIWKATDPNGRETIERIDSTDARAARQALEDRGLTNLRLQQEEMVEASAEAVKNVSNPDYAPLLSAEEEAAYFDGKIPGFWLQWWKSACLCCACSGDVREARKLWKEVNRYLEAAREDKLIARIRSALP